MSTWHVYPGFIRLVDNSHVPVVLILDVDQRVWSAPTSQTLLTPSRN